MVAKTPRGLTVIPSRARGERARGELIALIYDELRRVASRLMLRERAGRTLPPTAVAHEDVNRLLGEGALTGRWTQFLFASAARAMREVLIDHARGRAGARYGRGMQRVPLDSVVDYFERLGPDVVAVHEALDRLAALDGRQAQVMPLRYFGGMIVAEVAAALNVSVATVEKDWRLARAWLAGQLREGAG